MLFTTQINGCKYTGLSRLNVHGESHQYYLDIALLVCLITGIYSFLPIFSSFSHRNQPLPSIFFKYVFGCAYFDLSLISCALYCEPLIENKIYQLQFCLKLSSDYLMRYFLIRFFHFLESFLGLHFFYV